MRPAPLPDDLYSALVLVAFVLQGLGIILVVIGAVRRRGESYGTVRRKLLQFWGATLFIEGVLQYFFWALLNARDRSIVWLIGAIAFVAVPYSAYVRTRAIETGGRLAEPGVGSFCPSAKPRSHQ